MRVAIFRRCRLRFLHLLGLPLLFAAENASNQRRSGNHARAWAKETCEKRQCRRLDTDQAFDAHCALRLRTLKRLPDAEAVEGRPQLHGIYAHHTAVAQFLNILGFTQVEAVVRGVGGENTSVPEVLFEAALFLDDKLWRGRRLWLSLHLWRSRTVAVATVAAAAPVPVVSVGVRLCLLRSRVAVWRLALMPRGRFRPHGGCLFHPLPTVNAPVFSDVSSFSWAALHPRAFRTLSKLKRKKKNKKKLRNKRQSLLARCTQNLRATANKEREKQRAGHTCAPRGWSWVEFGEQRKQINTRWTFASQPFFLFIVFSLWSTGKRTSIRV